MSESAFQKCINPACAATFDVAQVLVSCPKCGGLLDILYDWEKLPRIKGLGFFEHRWSTKGVGVEGTLDFSGVWRFRELLPFYRREDQTSSPSARAAPFSNRRICSPARWGWMKGNCSCNMKG